MHPGAAAPALLESRLKPGCIDSLKAGVLKKGKRQKWDGKNEVTADTIIRKRKVDGQVISEYVGRGGWVDLYALSWTVQSAREGPTRFLPGPSVYKEILKPSTAA